MIKLIDKSNRIHTEGCKGLKDETCAGDNIYDINHFEELVDIFGAEDLAESSADMFDSFEQAVVFEVGCAAHICACARTEYDAMSAKYAS